MRESLNRGEGGQRGHLNREWHQNKLHDVNVNGSLVVSS